MESQSAPTTPVQAVARAFRLLEALADRDEAGLVELARACSLHASTAHRLLASLIDCGYASQSPRNGRYRLGRKVLELVNGSKARDARLREVARPHLEAIRTAVDETTNLVALDGRDAIYIDQVESQHAVRLFAEPGRRVPAHTSGAGKAMLAHQEESLLATLYTGSRLDRLTAHTVTDPSAFTAELARVRRRGFAIDDEEYEEGVSCVGAPIFDNLGLVCAALSVSAPSSRLRRLGIAQLGGLLGSHASQVSLELGYVGTTARRAPAERNARPVI